MQEGVQKPGHTRGVGLSQLLQSISHLFYAINFIDGAILLNRSASDQACTRRQKDSRPLTATAGENHTYLNVSIASIDKYKIARVGAIVRTKYARRIKNILIVDTPVTVIAYRQ